MNQPRFKTVACYGAGFAVLIAVPAMAEDIPGQPGAADAPIATQKERDTLTGDWSGARTRLHVLMANKVLKCDVTPGFTIDLAFKDMTLAINAAAENRVGLPVGSAAHAVFGGARATDYAAKDYSALLAYACENAGVETPRLD